MIAAVAAVWGVGGPSAVFPQVQAAGQPTTPEAAPSARIPGDDLSMVTNRHAAMASREAAARRLLSSVDAESRARVDALLSSKAVEAAAAPESGSEPGADPSQSGRLVLVRVISAEASAPPWLAASLIQIGRADATDGPQQAERAAAIAALGSIRTRDAVRGLIAIAGASDTPQPMASACYGALARLSGHEEFGTDHRAWSMWLTQIEWLPEAEWRRLLAEGLAGQMDTVLRERDAAVARLLESFKKDVQSASTIEDRSRVIERAMREDIGSVRRAGFAAALQELANARTLDQRVAKAAADLLRSDQVQTRRAAAELLNVLAPSGLSEELERSLGAETDASVAAVLLRGVTRWASAGMKDSVLKWLEYGEPTRTPAIDAAEALLDKSLLQDEPSRARVLAALGRTPVDQLSAAGMRLLFVLGNQDARDAVMRSVRSADPAKAQVVAESLAKDPAALELLLNAARTDESLFAPTVRALAAHQANAEGYGVAQSLPTSSPELRRSMLLQLGSRLPPTDLLSIARREDSTEMREALLARLVSEPLRRTIEASAPSSMPGPTFTQHPSVVAGLLLLAETRLELGQPAAALKAIDALAPMGPGVDAPLRASLRTEALVWLGRLDEAQAASGSPEAWLTGLWHCADQPHAGQVVALIESRFKDKLSPDLVTRLAALRERATTFVGPKMIR